MEYMITDDGSTGHLYDLKQEYYITMLYKCQK